MLTNEQIEKAKVAYEKALVSGRRASARQSIILKKAAAAKITATEQEIDNWLIAHKK